MSTKNPKMMSEDDRLQLRKMRIEFCKKSAKFVCSNAGLGIIIVLYTIGGAYVFQALENTNEKTTCMASMNKYIPMENQTANSLWSIALAYPTDDQMDEAIQALRTQVQSFRDSVLLLNYDGSNCSAMGEPDGPGYQWSFSGALLFSVTVYTTVGTFTVMYLINCKI